MASVMASPMSSSLPPPVTTSAASSSNPPSSAVRVVARSIPLLPPLARAQAILDEMAGLTSRIAELGGGKLWQSLLIKASNFLPNASISPEAAAAVSTKELLAMVESHQDLLFEAIGEISKLQEMQLEKQKIAEVIESKDLMMRNFAKRLRDAEQVLEHTLEEHENYRKPKQNNGEVVQEAVGLGSVDVSELVACAHRISYTTFAPPEYATGQAPLCGALPPAPQDEQMRASQLYQAADLDIGLPKATVTVTSPAAVVDASTEMVVNKTEVAQAHKPPSPPIPSGWRPRMPIELPPDLPPMPPGWKPGDPIPLPANLEIPSLPPGWKPGDPVVLPSSAAVPKPPDQATPKPPLPPSIAPPGVIQVPFVQLDLNPELEDEYGSDYSDDDGSSEDDED